MENNRAAQSIYSKLLAKEFARNWDETFDSDAEEEIYRLELNWIIRVRKALSRSLSKKDAVLCRKRSSDERQKFWYKWNNLDNYEEFRAKLENLIPLFTLKDFAARFLAMKNEVRYLVK